MYVNVCAYHAKRFEERVRHYEQINLKDSSKTILRKDDLFIMDNLKPCKNYSLSGKFRLERIKPEPKETIDDNVDKDIYVYTGI